jgi:hypothetical protein
MVHLGTIAIDMKKKSLLMQEMLKPNQELLWNDIYMLH